MIRSAFAVLLCSGLLLSGCSGGSDPAAKPAAEPSTSAASPSPSASATEAAAPKVLDPCDMVPEKVWHRFVPKRRVQHAVLERRFVTQSGILISDHRVRYACQLGFDYNESKPVTWGYFPGTFFNEDMNKLLKGAGGTPTTGKLPFVAFTTGDITTSDAFGIVGTTGLFVTAEEESDSILHGDTRTEKGLLVSVLRQLGKHVDPSQVQAKRDVPDLCPQPTGPEVSAAYGKVDLARGGENGEGRTWCVYRSLKTSSDLRLDAYHLTDDSFKAFYASTRKNPNDVDMFDPAPGMIRMVSIGDDGSGDTILLDPDTRLYIHANITYAASKRRDLDLDRQAFLALARSYFDSMAQTAG